MDPMSHELAPARPAAPSRFRSVLVLLLMMWVLEFADLLLPGDLDYFGIRPRSLPGLSGIFFAPLLHVGFSHLVANTVPFLVLGCLVALGGQGRFWRVTVIVTVLSGLGVWLLGGTGTVTVGASGLIFGYLGYLLVFGARTRNLLDITIAVIVALVYGGVLGGALPWMVGHGVSWLGHLCGAAAGVVAAWQVPPSRS